MAKAPQEKKKRKPGPGRPKGRRNNVTVLREMLRDLIVPSMAKTYGTNDPTEAIAMWANEDQEHKDWLFRTAIEIMREGAAGEISQEQIQIETIRANAQQPGDNQGSPVTNVIVGTLPVDPSRQLSAPEEIIDAVVVEQEPPKQLEQKDEKDCLDE